MRKRMGLSIPLVPEKDEDKKLASLLTFQTPDSKRRLITLWWINWSNPVRCRNLWRLFCTLPVMPLKRNVDDVKLTKLLFVNFSLALSLLLQHMRTDSIWRGSRSSLAPGFLYLPPLHRAALWETSWTNWARRAETPPPPKLWTPHQAAPSSAGGQTVVSRSPIIPSRARVPSRSPFHVPTKCRKMQTPPMDNVQRRPGTRTDQPQRSLQSH